MEDKLTNENNKILGMKTCACFPKNALLKILVSYEAKNVQMSSSSFFETWVFTTPVFRTLDNKKSSKNKSNKRSEHRSRLTNISVPSGV